MASQQAGLLEKEFLMGAPCLVCFKYSFKLVDTPYFQVIFIHSCRKYDKIACHIYEKFHGDTKLTIDSETHRYLTVRRYDFSLQATEHSH